MKIIIEPFRIKAVDPIKLNTKSQRSEILKNSDFNLFQIRSEDVIVDLLTDSGTGAMSSEQWAGIMRGDESYAGSNSYLRFKKSVQEVFGFSYVLPVHQGRAAERILFSTLCNKGDLVPSNMHFDTTRANILAQNATPVDLMSDKFKDTQFISPFKGNMSIDKLTDFLDKTDISKVPLIMLTITNNSGGGQPVSMNNIKEIYKIAKKYKIPFYIDACRFAENAYFIQQREEKYKNVSIPEIVMEMFSYADGCTMSAKKDGIANIGGFLCTNDKQIATKSKNLLILTEGFTTYGGLAGRDLEAIALGIKEVMDQDYLNYRIKSISYLGDRLLKCNIPLLRPIGGHAVYIDAKLFASHLDISVYPAQSLACELYIEGGVRTSEIGSFMFGGADENGEEFYSDFELVRLAIPRRTYTQSHIDYVVEVVDEVYRNKEKLKGLEIIEQSKYLRHFTGRLKQIG